MTKKRKVKASAFTHFNNLSTVDVEQGDSSLSNSQEGMMLIDPEDSEIDGVSTHSEKTPQFRGPAVGTVRAKVKASDAGSAQKITDEDRPTGGSAKVPNEVDPAAGYLRRAAGMPVIESSVDDFSDPDELELAADADGDTFVEDEIIADGNAEFDDLSEVDAADDEFEEATALDPEDANDDAGAELDVMADFENVEESAEHVPLVDVDEVVDQEEGDLVFASVGNALHVIRSNRIIASMGPASATRADVADVYQLPQFQSVVASAVAKKGLRKGLVQAGFVLAKVKLTASKATARVINARVESQVTQKLEVLARRDQVLEQSLAIAATGINKHFFKGTTNELKAALETELEQAGVRGGTRMVRAMFAKYGVSYAKSLLTLAKKISAMPDEVRDQYVEALDMTGDDADPSLDDDLEIDGEVDDDMEMDEPRSVTAALSRPLRSINTQSILRASKGHSGAYEILSGNQSLV